MVRVHVPQQVEMIQDYKYSIFVIIVLVILYLPGFSIEGLDLKSLLYNEYFIAFIVAYVLTGIVADFITRAIVKKVWQKTTESYKEVLRSRNYKEPLEKYIPFWLHSENRKPFNWAPRIIGVLERPIYTTAMIFNQFILIGVWLAFKAIGEWSDFSSTKGKRGKSDIEEGTTRIRANNFLIGTAITLIFGILGGIIFQIIIQPSCLINLIKCY